MRVLSVLHILRVIGQMHGVLPKDVSSLSKDTMKIDVKKIFHTLPTQTLEGSKGCDSVDTSFNVIPKILQDSYQKGKYLPKTIFGELQKGDFSVFLLWKIT